jgi:AbrB family looped-hinge helix DNA binding protein
MSDEPGFDVEFMITTRLGEKGQLTVPKEYRNALRMEVGATLAVLRIGNGLLLIPEQARFRQLCDRIAGAFAHHGIKADDVLASLPEARRRVFDRHYAEQGSARRSGRRPRRA